MRTEARDWIASKRSEGWLARQRDRLKDAQTLLADPDFGPGLGGGLGGQAGDVGAYLTACTAKETADRERENRLKEAEIAAAKEREDAARRTAAAARRVTWGALVALIFMSWLGWLIYGQWQEGLRKESLFLADLAQEQIAKGDAGTARLLALEALRDERASAIQQKLRPLVAQAQNALDASARKGVWLDRVMAGHQGIVTAVAFSPDGKTVLTGSWDKTARLWENLSIQDEIDRARHNLTHCLTPTQRARFHLSPTPPRWCHAANKWPYHDPEQTPPPPPSWSERLAQTYDAIAASLNKLAAQIKAMWRNAKTGI